MFGPSSLTNLQLTNASWLCLNVRLIDQNNIERTHAIHESRLASVKASLSLSTPRRMDFMDKRLSKNFHMRRHHKQVVHENLKLLRALEEIHSRSSTAATVAGTESLTGGGGGASLTTGGPKGRKLLMSKSASNTTGSSVSRKKLSSLLARKRNVKAAIVARENQKMMEVSHMCHAPELWNTLPTKAEHKRPR